MPILKMAKSNIAVLRGFFADKDVAGLEEALKDTLFRKQDVLNVLEQAGAAEYFIGAKQEDLMEFFAQSILE